MYNHASMNKVYRIVWNATLGVWQAVGEIGKGAGKGTSDRRRNRTQRNSLAGALFLLSSSVYAASLPTDGVVSLGSGSIQQPNSSTLNITQNTQKMAIDWQSFSIGQGNSVNFIQPNSSAIALNRVVGNDVSNIQGAINANGQVFLINPNGVLFSTTAQVNVGALVASTRNLTNENFAAGNFAFEGNSSSAIINQGNIKTAEGGYVVMIAAKIDNAGNVGSKNGFVGMGAGDLVTLDMGGPVKLKVNQGTLSALISNGGAIQADAGHVLLTAKAAGDLAASVINNTGIVEATGITQAGGTIALSADIVSQTGSLNVSSSQGKGGNITVNASLLIDSGSSSANGAQGGSIIQSANDIQQSSNARLSANASNGKGGDIRINGGDVAYLSGSVQATGAQGGSLHVSAKTLTAAGLQADTSGSQQAGEMLIGGGWQGKDSRVLNAQTTNVSNTSQLSNQGSNGTVLVWSDNQTTFNGSIDAKGSAVEISGKENLSAYLGKVQAQSLLLDPKNIEIKAAVSNLSFTTIANPNATAGDGFGTQVTELSNGNLVISAPSSDLLGETTVANVGRVYLYNANGTLVSTLSGSTANDNVGNGGVTTLSNGNFVIRSAGWNNAAATLAGAVTWVNGSTGLSGVVSSSNSLVGDGANYQIGTGVTALTNGNYVVSSTQWGWFGSGLVLGAATWGNGTGGTTGVVNASNSLVGVNGRDSVGSGGIIALTNGNYVVVSKDWAISGTQTKAGAVTWGSGTGGTVGTVDATNSLVGSITNDSVGSSGILALSNGNYVVRSTRWDAGNGAFADAGAVTWGNGTGGTKGTIDATNSLVGSKALDSVGAGAVVELSNGDYVVAAPNWDNVSLIDAGAVTWGNGTAGTKGTIDATNSLIGLKAYDSVGNMGVTALSNGNYVIASPSWGDSTNVLNAGAVTWVNASDSANRVGTINATNSLTGAANDSVGIGGVTALSNGNYVIRSTNWNQSRGAATWVNGTTGLVGTVDSSNSLVGSTAVDSIGGAGITLLSDGNYVVRSSFWDKVVDASTTIANVGAVTWVNASDSNSRTGTVSTANSLVGSTLNDGVGGTSVVALNDGNYVVVSKLWDNDTITDAGAVTWVNASDSNSRTGTVSTANSLVGSTLNDSIGGAGITLLSNGNYVVRSTLWDNTSSATNAGAVTWGNGATGVVGAVGSNNSLVGSSTNDSVGSNGVIALSNGSYAVASSNWDNTSSATNAGAVTWGNATGTTGTISSSNSILGTNASQGLGGGAVIALSSGKVAVGSATAGTGGAVYITDGSGAGGGTADAVSTATFGNNASGNSIITPDSITALLNAGTAVTLQANNDITVTEAVVSDNTSGNGGTFKLQAGRSIAINNSIFTDNGDFIAVAGAAGADANNRDAGASSITLGTNGSINAGTGKVNLVATGTGASFTNNSGVSNPIQAAIASIYLPTYNVAASGGNLAQTFFTKGNLTTTGKLYNTSYNQSTDTGSCGFANCVMPTSGINVFYAATPTISVAPTTGQSSTYGSAFTASGQTYSGFVDGDTDQTAVISGTALFTIGGSTSSSGNYTAGSHDIAYSDGLVSSLGYTFADANTQTGELTVNQKVVTGVNGIGGANKSYDGTATATIAGTTINTVLDGQGKLNGDVVVGLSGITAQYASKDAGVRVITLTGGTLGGADGGNYSVVGVNNNNSLSGTIGQKLLTLANAPTIANKAYDGTSAAAVTLNGAVTGFATGESATVTATGRFTSNGFDEVKDVGNGIRVSLTPVFNDVSGGALTSNYQLPASYGGRGATLFNANITPRDVAVTADAKSKSQGSADPALTYQVAAATQTTGLVTGETLVGSLSRAAGETVGDYEITQGTVNNASNPNYNVSYTSNNLTIQPTQAPTVAPTTVPANAARGTAAQLPVQPVVTTPIAFTPVIIQTPTIATGTANAGSNGVSGGLVFVEAPSAAPNNAPTPTNNAKPTTNAGTNGVDAAGFMRVSVVQGGINSGNNNE